MEATRAAVENRRLAAVVEQSADFIGVARADGTVAFVNPAGLALVGLPDLAAARAIKISEFFAPEDRGRVMSEVLPGVERRRLLGRPSPFPPL